MMRVFRTTGFLRRGMSCRYNLLSRLKEPPDKSETVLPARSHRLSLAHRAGPKRTNTHRSSPPFSSCTMKDALDVKANQPSSAVPPLTVPAMTRALRNLYVA